MRKIFYTLFINIKYYLLHYTLLPLAAAAIITLCCLAVHRKKEKSTLSLFEYIKIHALKKEYICRFALSLYLLIAVQSTVIDRLFTHQFHQPLSDVFGDWLIEETQYFYDLSVIWNIVLFIPMAMLIWIYTQYTIKKDFHITSLFMSSAAFSFAVSLFIECSQIIFKVGTFQFSDLFYNTLGGVLGSVFMIIFKKIIHKKKTSLKA